MRCNRRDALGHVILVAFRIVGLASSQPQPSHPLSTFLPSPSITRSPPSCIYTRFVMINNSKLCSFCQVVISTTELDQKAPFHPSSASLKSSANGGCPLCAILWDFYADHKKLSNLKLHEINDKLGYEFQLTYRSDSDDYMYQFWVTLPDELVSDETPLTELEMPSNNNVLIMPISGENPRLPSFKLQYLRQLPICSVHPVPSLCIAYKIEFKHALFANCC